MRDTIFAYNGISKQFFGVSALKFVSFSVKEGSVLGLIGENGAGKSTLMNIIGGNLKPDEGSMTLHGKKYRPASPAEASEKGIEFIHQELNLFTNLSVAENIYIHNFPMSSKVSLINHKQMIKNSKNLLDKFDLDINPATLVESLSPGEKQMVEIVKALSTDASIFLFDEPTTSLTSNETEKLFKIINQLKKENKSIIYISHILGDVQNICDDIVVLRDGEVTGEGRISEFPVSRMISTMVGRKLSQIYPDKNNVVHDHEIIRIQNLGHPGIVGDINFSVKKGEVVGIFGLMGSGRTELAKMIFGIDKYTDGSIVVEGKPLPTFSPQACISMGMAFITEDRREEGLLMDVSISENMGLVSMADFSKSIFKIVDSKSLYAKAEKLSKDLKLKAANIRNQLAQSLSGGNQQKVVIGKWLMKEPNLLIMDEPTRGIDVGAKFEVYSIVNDLAGKGSGILVISSEVEELIGICDRIIVMSRGEIINYFDKENFNKEEIMLSAFRQSISTMKGEENEPK